MAQSPQKIALITGVTGQDGAYLAEFCSARAISSTAIKRRSSSFNTGRVDHLYQDPHEQGVPFSLALWRYDRRDQPDPHRPGNAARRNLQSGRPKPRAGLVSRRRNIPRMPTRSARCVCSRRSEFSAVRSKTRFYQASTSELYGKVQEMPQKRNDAVLSALALCGGQALCLLDHGQLSRGLRHACLERHSVQSREPDPRRNIRHAQDHARRRGDRARPARQALSRQSRCQARLGPCPRLCRRHVADRCSRTEPDDYVLATGETHSVREFVEKAFAHVGRSIEWQGSGVDEKGIDRSSGEVLVEIDPRYFRPTEVDLLLGDPTKARTKLGWQPRTGFEELVREMVDADLAGVRFEQNTARYAMNDLAVSGQAVRSCRTSGYSSPAIAAWSARRSCGGLRAASASMLTAGRDRVDLLRQDATERFLADKRPQVVIVAAAKVGGIHANNTFPAEFIYENLAIATNVIHGAIWPRSKSCCFSGHRASIRSSPASR